MRMTAHKEIRPVKHQIPTNSRRIAARPAANVRHPNICTARLKALVFWALKASGGIINIAIHHAKRSQFRQLICDTQVANISGVPNFITVFKMMQDPVIHMPVGIADKSNTNAVHKAGNYPRLSEIATRMQNSFVKNTSVSGFLLAAGLIFSVGLGQCLAQPGRSRLSSSDKKALKWYDRALDEMTALRRGEAAADTAAIFAAVRRSVQADPDFAEPHFLAGAVWAEHGQWVRAVEANNRGLLVGPAVHPRAYLENARMLQQLLRPALMRDAALGYIDLLSTQSAGRRIALSTEDSSRVAALVASADFMERALAAPVPYAPRALGSQINSSAPEYFPTLFDGGDQLLFTRKVPREFGEGQEDFFLSRLGSDGLWTPARPMLALNTAENEGAASVSMDGLSMIFTRCGSTGKGSCDLYFTSPQAHEPPTNIGALNTSTWESQPCLSWDGRTVVFTRRTANRQSTDLFMAHRSAEASHWSAPERMAGNINTPGREQSGFIHPDGRHFYFASNNHPGMGGMDLFVCTLEQDGRWGAPVNLGYPINTPRDETGLIVSPDGKTAYFSSTAADQDPGHVEMSGAHIGNMDIYTFELPEAVRATATLWFRGRVTSARDGKALEAHVTLTDLESGRPLADMLADQSGHFAVPVPSDRLFALSLEHEGYLLYSGHFSRNIEAAKSSGRAEHIELQPLETGAEIVLHNIFFDSGSAALDAHSDAELHNILDLTELNGDTRFEVGGHTDDVGSSEDNHLLSEQRAQAVVDWLTDHGVASHRLTARGYGESMPLSKTVRAVNRRTTLGVL